MANPDCLSGEFTGTQVFKLDREQAFAKTALALMGERGVVATPDNFELFYAYACGAYPRHHSGDERDDGGREILHA